jgi:5'-nucleotidase
MDRDGKEVYVVQAFWGGKYLGFLDVEVDPECRVTKISGDPILLDRSITPDPDLDKLVKEWKIPFELLSNQFVANLSTDLFTRDCVNQSCPLGNLVTGCMVSLLSRTRTHS